jgi:MFS transporter, OFA family, oxalate/formate antiporter
MFSGTLLSSGGLLLLSQATNLGMFYGAFFLMTMGTTVTLNVVPTTVIIRWFRHKVGKATSIFAIGIGVGGFMVPLTTMMIDNLGWQQAILILAGVTLVIGLPLSLVFRDRPEDYGLLPDGGPIKQKNNTPRRPEPPSLTVKQALKTRVFWQFGVATTCYVAGISGYVWYVMPYLEASGVTRQTASIVAMLVPAGSIPARLLMGWLADRYPKRKVTAMAVSICGIGLLLFANVSLNPTFFIAAFVIVLALGISGLTPLPPIVAREYFGTRHFGAIFGLMGVFFTIGTVSTPLTIGAVLDRTGGFSIVWWVLGGLALIGAVIMYYLPKPIIPDLPGVESQKVKV